MSVFFNRTLFLFTNYHLNIFSFPQVFFSINHREIYVFPLYHGNFSTNQQYSVFSFNHSSQKSVNCSMAIPRRGSAFNHGKFPTNHQRNLLPILNSMIIYIMSLLLNNGNFSNSRHQNRFRFFNLFFCHTDLFYFFILGAMFDVAN